MTAHRSCKQHVMPGGSQGEKIIVVVIVIIIVIIIAVIVNIAVMIISVVATTITIRSGFWVESWWG